MRIIAYGTSIRDDKVLLEESTGEFILDNDVYKLFSFLLEPYEDTLKVCWDLDNTVSVFLRLLGRTACRALQRAKKWREPPWAIFYIPDKVFSVSYGRNKANLYGLEQYFPELDEPDLQEVQGLGMKLLGELKKMGLTPTKLTSPVAIYEKNILSHLDLPLVKDIPLEVAEFAWKCSGRLWVEAHCLGYWDDKG